MGQRYVATILFATSQSSHDRQVRDLQRKALDNDSRFARRAGSATIALLDTPAMARAAN
ncbi:hypothetical protein PMI04_016540 [Sphingobium sp. AP49]|uniref:hypothetical protein n=1 Tax=Sphingobium sp. AP49 TaxID=1144307 RepID=UPI0024B38DC3|nr:hypothetical protein [Sphingobium sp. AP49]WHO38153.1 hypothetical protein PMI04_016540 [Sphingobium sp. AP49]